MKKIDFSHMLTRRRFTVQRWLESEQIGTWKSFKNWMKQNDSMWSFSESFVLEAKGILQGSGQPQEQPKAPEPTQPKEVPAEPQEAPEETSVDRPKKVGSQSPKGRVS